MYSAYGQILSYLLEEYIRSRRRDVLHQKLFFSEVQRSSDTLLCIIYTVRVLVAVVAIATTLYSKMARQVYYTEAR